MDFIRKGSADLYHSATPRLYKEQQSPKSITVGLLLTSTFISHSQLPSHTTSTTCYFTLKQHSATEVYLPKEWKGKRRMTRTRDGWAAWGLTIMEQCSYKTSTNLLPATVCEPWSGRDGLFISHFILSQVVIFNFRWWEVTLTNNCWMKWEKTEEIRGWKNPLQPAGRHPTKTSDPCPGRYSHCTQSLVAAPIRFHH